MGGLGSLITVSRRSWYWSLLWCGRGFLPGFTLIFVRAASGLIGQWELEKFLQIFGAKSRDVPSIPVASKALVRCDTAVLGWKLCELAHAINTLPMYSAARQTHPAISQLK